MKKPSRPRNDQSLTDESRSGAARYNLRVIGGQYRSRKLQFADAAGLRPTPDRVRETLFNWLAPLIDGARCLDAFAGSGALGIEALSRGAGHVDFFEASKPAADAIAGNLQTLQCGNATLRHGDVIAYLQSTPACQYDPACRYDIVFCDPPFQSPLLAQILDALLAQPWLTPTARLYVEASRDDTVMVPSGWHWHRHQYAGNVQYGLLQQD
jgi:16S rRNA (guanine966-N2)-methyltransferase